MSRYEEYEAALERARDNGNEEMIKYYERRMKNILKCRKWREGKA